jgi:catechol 2,3-dioxygenase-like lactoylglutathione lyase family enzyme
MNRFHVHVNVTDLDASIRFYSELFAARPAVVKPDYAKWMLDDPRVNFAISHTGRAAGVDHLGIQVESTQALELLGKRLDAAGGTVVPEEAAVCCYAKSEKLWTEDPQGTRWETFHTHGESTTYYAGDAACATDGAACTSAARTTDVAALTPEVASGGPCCAPKAACC